MLYNLINPRFSFLLGVGDGGWGVSAQQVFASKYVFKSLMKLVIISLYFFIKTSLCIKKIHKVNKAITIITTAQLTHKTVRTN